MGDGGRWRGGCVWGWWGGGVSSSLCLFGAFSVFFLFFPLFPHLPPLSLHTPSPHLSRSIKPATTTNPSSYPHSPPRDLYPIPSSRHAIRIPSPPIYHNPSSLHQTQSPSTPNPPPPSHTNPQIHKPANPQTAPLAQLPTLLLKTYWTARREGGQSRRTRWWR